MTLPQVLVTASLVLLAPVAAAQAPEEDLAAIRAVLAATAAANNAGDVAAWVRLFSDDAVYMAPGAAPVTTREGREAVAAAGFRHQADVHIEADEIKVLGEWAFARTHVTGTVRLHGTGEVVEVDVKQLVLYVRDGDHWKIARMISNSNR